MINRTAVVLRVTRYFATRDVITLANRVADWRHGLHDRGMETELVCDDQLPETFEDFDVESLADAVSD